MLDDKCLLYLTMFYYMLDQPWQRVWGYSFKHRGMWARAGSELELGPAYWKEIARVVSPGLPIGCCSLQSSAQWDPWTTLVFFGYVNLENTIPVHYAHPLETHSASILRAMEIL